MNRPIISAACFAILGTIAVAEDYVEVTECRIVPKQWARLATERIGVISVIEPEEGTKVEKDSAIVKLRDQVPQAVVEKAEKKISNDVERRYAVAAKDLAQAELDANYEVNKARPGTIPFTEIKRLELAVEKAELQIEQADHQREIDKLDLKEAKAQLQTYTIKAPFSGVVTRRYKEVGEAVQQGETILELVRTDVLKVEAHIDIEKLVEAGIATGNDVIVFYASKDRNVVGGKEEFRGKVTFVDSVIQPVTRHVRVVAEVKNVNGKRPGLTANMKIYPKGLPVDVKVGQAR